MVVPLVALGLGGLAVSGVSNIYRGYNSAKTYRQFARGYQALDKGYRDYLARHGRKINPHRALTSYYGNYIRNRTETQNSYLASVGSASGAFGAGAMTSRWL